MLSNDSNDGQRKNRAIGRLSPPPPLSPQTVSSGANDFFTSAFVFIIWLTYSLVYSYAPHDTFFLLTVFMHHKHYFEVLSIIQSKKHIFDKYPRPLPPPPSSPIRCHPYGSPSSGCDACVVPRCSWAGRTPVPERTCRTSSAPRPPPPTTRPSK